MEATSMEELKTIKLFKYIYIYEITEGGKLNQFLIEANKEQSNNNEYFDTWEQ